MTFGTGLPYRRGDRSIVTVAALIARMQSIGMLHYFNRALENGVTPRELSEMITHLAFYWAGPMLSPRWQ